MAASDDLQANLKKMWDLASQAKAKGAQLVCFPEMAYFMGNREGCLATTEKFDALKTEFSDWAQRLQLEIMPGTLRQPNPEDKNRPYNTLLHFSAEGTLVASYQKIFLFKANLPDRQYDESKISSAGSAVVQSQRPWGKVGYSICYDLRFPELFQAHRKAEVQFQFLPSAFTVPTGKAHWESLIRARAIESQLFMIAPALAGKCGDGRTTYGNSMIVSPWGEIMCHIPDTEGLAIAECSLKQITDARAHINIKASSEQATLEVS